MGARGQSRVPLLRVGVIVLLKKSKYVMVCVTLLRRMKNVLSQDIDGAIPAKFLVRRCSIRQRVIELPETTDSRKR